MSGKSLLYCDTHVTKRLLKFLIRTMLRHSIYYLRTSINFRLGSYLNTAVTEKVDFFYLLISERKSTS